MRTFARLVCFVLAFMGAVPVGLAAFLTSAPAERWAAEQTSLVLKQELGLAATFDVKVRLLPLRLAIENLNVPASDGGSPFLKAKSASLTPRLFSLLAGKLDVGEIEIDQPDARIVLRGGKLANLQYRLPKTKSKSSRTETPLGSLSIGEGRFRIDVDGVAVETEAIDLDVFAEPGGAFEVALRAGATKVDRSHAPLLKVPDPTLPPIVEEDALCRLDLRMHYDPGSVLVRRLSLLGYADLDPLPGTRPSCELEGEDKPGAVLARLSQVRVVTAEGRPPLIDGHVVVRAPIPLVNRFVRATPLSGFVAFAGDARWDGTHKLPALQGKLSGGGIQIGKIALAEKLDLDLSLQDDEVRVPHYYMRFADGDVHMYNAHVRPFAEGVPLSVEKVDGKGMLFHSMMRDLNVSPEAWVHWNLTSTKVSKIAGTLDPIKVDAELVAETHDFELFDKGYRQPTRQHMVGIKSPITIHARLGVRPKAFEIYDAKTEFGHSAMLAKLVSIAYTNGDVTLDVDTLSKLELSDISPLVTIPISGHAKADATMTMNDGYPTLLGNMKIDDFVIGGFPVGNIESSKAKFKLLYLELSDVVARKGSSVLRAPSARLDFDTRASLLVNVNAKSDAFDVRDFFEMWHFDEDPRFEDVKGKVGLDAQVRYVFGGPEDKCGGGVLQSKGHVKVLDLDMFGERYDGGDGEYDLNWFDRDATIQGVELDVPSITLRKGPGLILGSFGLRRGARVSGSMNGTEVPLSKLDSLPALFKAADGRATASAELSGTLDALSLQARAKISELRLGRATFPPSDLTVRLEPVVRDVKPIATSKCGLPIFPPLDKNEYATDKVAGIFHADGEMLGGQLRLEDLTFTRQRRKLLTGKVHFKNFDLGAATEILPQVALSDVRPSGSLSASIDIKRLDMDEPRSAAGSARITELRAEYNGYKLRVPPGSAPITLESGKLDVPALALEASTPRGQAASFDVSARLDKLGQGAQVDASFGLKPLPLATVLGMVPRVERAEGTISGRLRIFGALSAPRYQGGFELNEGEVALRGLSTPVSDIALSLSVDGSEVNIVRGTARLGSGTVSLRGGAPLRGFEIGGASVAITGRNLSIPSTNGIHAVADADLIATFQSAGATDHRLPRLAGNVSLKSFEYKRPVTMTADISALAQRGKRTEFDAYDPNDDALDLDIRITSERSLRLQNNLIEAELLLDERGLELSGTNARYGLRGDVNIKPGGRIKLRRSEFEIKEGRVRFDDVTRIAPSVDVTAVTEYRRYSTSQTAGPTASSGAGAAAANSASASSAAAARGRRFRITMRAHGDADKLKIDLTSDPALAQDDIFLLITIGLTRAELDQAQSASVGESVALEALGTLSGADKAVTDAVPIIDELRFGSAYSSRTGRTEPTITIGKRLAERIRANVTSGVAESREIRSNVEWQLSPRVSVEGSYDNVNDISSSSLGNLGADVRWRMEFE